MVFPTQHTYPHRNWTNGSFCRKNLCRFRKKSEKFIWRQNIERILGGISGSLNFAKTSHYIKRDTNALKFKDANNPEASLSDLLSTGGLGGIQNANMDSGYGSAKLRTTGSLAVTPALAYVGETAGIGEDVFVALGATGARADTAANRTTVLSIGDFITSGSAHLLGREPGHQGPGTFVRTL